MASTQGIINWFRARQGKVTYSMDYRNGPNSYDCSSAIYSALREAGYKLDISWNGNTESLFGTLEKLGWKKIPRSQAKAGDIFIWGVRGASGGAFGHTGVFTSNTNILHCNYGYNGITENPYDLIRQYNGYPTETIYTPTGGGNSTPTPPASNGAFKRVPEVATFYPNTTIKIRSTPEVKANNDTGLVYNAGMSVRYDSYVINGGYVWISWISASTGARRYMAIREWKNGQAQTLWGTIK